MSSCHSIQVGVVPTRASCRKRWEWITEIRGAPKVASCARSRGKGLDVAEANVDFLVCDFDDCGGGVDVTIG